MKVTEFVKNSQTVQFSYFRAGFLYFETQRHPEGSDEIEVYQFPIDATDLQQSTVERSMKAITLMRYIRKSIEENTLVFLRKFKLSDL